MSGKKPSSDISEDHILQHKRASKPTTFFGVTESKPSTSSQSGAVQSTKPGKGPSSTQPITSVKQTPSTLQPENPRPVERTVESSVKHPIPRPVSPNPVRRTEQSDRTDQSLFLTPPRVTTPSRRASPSRELAASIRNTLQVVRTVSSRLHTEASSSPAASGNRSTAAVNPHPTIEPHQQQSTGVANLSGLQPVQKKPSTRDERRSAEESPVVSQSSSSSRRSLDFLESTVFDNSRPSDSGLSDSFSLYRSTQLNESSSSSSGNSTPTPLGEIPEEDEFQSLQFQPFHQPSSSQQQIQQSSQALSSQPSLLPPQLPSSGQQQQLQQQQLPLLQLPSTVSPTQLPSLQPPVQDPSSQLTDQQQHHQNPPPEQQQQQQQPSADERGNNPNVPSDEDDPTDSDSSSASSESVTPSSEPWTDEEDMAERPSRAYIPPPTFSGRKGEDALEFINKYERVAEFNNWGQEKQLKCILMFLSEGALHWAERMKQRRDFPTEWNQVAVDARPAEGGNPAVPAQKAGFRQVFEAEFLHGSQRAAAIRALQKKHHSDYDSPVMYFYGIMKLCDTVDLNMRDEDRLQHLYRGLDPDLVHAMHMWKLKTPDQVLEHLKTASVADEMTDRPSKKVTIAAVDMPRVSATWQRSSSPSPSWRRSPSPYRQQQPVQPASNSPPYEKQFNKSNDKNYKPRSSQGTSSNETQELISLAKKLLKRAEDQQSSGSGEQSRGRKGKQTESDFDAPLTEEELTEERTAIEED